MGIQVQPCCCGCACEDCAGTEAEQYSATLFSFSNNSCTDCTDLNTTFILDRDLTGYCAEGEAYEDHPCCCWAYYFPDGEPCGAYRLTLVITSNTTALLILESDPGAGGYWSFTWFLTLGGICTLTDETTSAPLIDGTPPCLGIVSYGQVSSV